MSDPPEPSSTASLITRGAAAFNEGRLADARALFARALLANPESEAGWLWFATVTEDPGEQRYALNRALAVNPESSGLHRLVLLPRGPATTPCVDRHRCRGWQRAASRGRAGS